MAKTKVAPIKRLTIPHFELTISHLELCGALVVADLACHAANLLGIPTERPYTWTNSLIVLSWLWGNPGLLKH